MVLFFGGVSASTSSLYLIYSLAFSLQVEDGNNFGVSVQEETVNELSRAEDTSFALLDSMNKYLMTRGKLVSRVIKYPGLRDYTVSIDLKKCDCGYSCRANGSVEILTIWQLQTWTHPQCALHPLG